MRYPAPGALGVVNALKPKPSRIPCFAAEPQPQLERWPAVVRVPPLPRVSLSQQIARDQQHAQKKVLGIALPLPIRKV